MKLVNPKHEDWAPIQLLTPSVSTFLFTLPRCQVVFQWKQTQEKLGNALTQFRMGLFRAAHGWGGQKVPLPKICHTYPTMMKLHKLIAYSFIKKIRKTYKSSDTSLEFCWHQHLFIRKQQLLLYQEIQVSIKF